MCCNKYPSLVKTCMSCESFGWISYLKIFIDSLSRTLVIHRFNWPMNLINKQIWSSILSCDNYLTLLYFSRFQKKMDKHVSKMVNSKCVICKVADAPIRKMGPDRCHACASFFKVCTSINLGRIDYSPNLTVKQKQNSCIYMEIRAFSQKHFLCVLFYAS